MENQLDHPLDLFRGQWESARRRAAAGSVPDAIITVSMVIAFLQMNGSAENSANPPPGLPQWLVEDLTEILWPTIAAGASLDAAFHLKPKRGRSVMENVQRDMEISVASGAFPSMEEFADAAERWGIAPPGPGQPWTADALAKAIKAHGKRIKSGLLFRGADE